MSSSSSNHKQACLGTQKPSQITVVDKPTILSPLRAALLGGFLASTALAQGAVEIINACSFPVYYRLADSVSHFGNYYTLVANDGLYTEPQDMNGGRSIELTNDPDNFSVSGGPFFTLTLEYTVTPSTNGETSYDLSTVHGDPFYNGNTVLLATTIPTCPTSDVGPDSQESNGEGIVRTCSSTANLFLTLCNTGS